MPERPRRFHQAGNKTSDDAALPGEAEIVELKDRRDAELEQRDREFAGGVLAERRIGPLPADQHVIEALAQREQLVLDIKDDVLHASVHGLQNAADGVGFARARRALNHGARADQFLGKRNVGIFQVVGGGGHNAMLMRVRGRVRQARRRAESASPLVRNRQPSGG